MKKLLAQALPLQEAARVEEILTATLLLCEFSPAKSFKGATAI
jgi:hypothetical protein